MSINKKKINVNTVANTSAKSIDSFFTISSTSSTSNIADNTNNTSVIEANTPFLIESNNCNGYQNMIDTRENVLKTLMQHKIMYAHTEIKNKIDNLSEDEMTEIFKIIKNNNEKYSTNKNGIFINLITLKKNTIQEISNFLYFCDNNNKVIIEEEIERAKYKEMMNE